VNLFSPLTKPSIWQRKQYRGLLNANVGGNEGKTDWQNFEGCVHILKPKNMASAYYSAFKSEITHIEAKLFSKFRRYPLATQPTALVGCLFGADWTENRSNG
jgi:hypothetical protein